jgi:hypothetical protein
MAVGPRLHAYLAFERAMVDLDAAGDPLADALRDRMDDVWWALSDDDRELLDRRSGAAEQFAGIVPAVESATEASGADVVLLPAVLEVLGAAP